MSWFSKVVNHASNEIKKGISHATKEIAKTGTSITKATNEAFTIKNYTSTSSFVKLASHNPLAGGFVGLPFFVSKKTSEGINYASDRIPFVKNAVNYYQEHVGNAIQQEYDHIAHQFSCAPEVGGIVTTTAGIATGALASPAVGGLVSTGLGTAFKQGYSNCIPKEQITPQEAQQTLQSDTPSEVQPKSQNWIWYVVGSIGIIFIFMIIAIRR